MDLGVGGKRRARDGREQGHRARRRLESLAREGARVAVASRSPDRIEQTAAELRSDTGADVRPFTADAEAPEALPGLVQSVREALGPVEILVVKHGGPPPATPCRSA